MIAAWVWLALAAVGAAAGAPAPERVLLLDEVIEAPAAGWRAVEVALRQRPAIVECRFTVVRGHSGVRVALLRREDVGRFRGGRAHRVLAATGFEHRGGFRYAAGAGDYAVLVDNRLEGRGPAAVRLEVTLEFPAVGAPLVRELSPARRRAVIAVSLAVFAGLVWLAARGLRRALSLARRTPE